MSALTTSTARPQLAHTGVMESTAFLTRALNTSMSALISEDAVLDSTDASTVSMVSYWRRFSMSSLVTSLTFPRMLPHLSSQIRSLVYRLARRPMFSLVTRTVTFMTPAISVLSLV